MIEAKKHEYCVFVFRRGNSFNGMKLNEDGSIIYEVEHDHDIDYNKREYINTNELTIEHKYGEEANSIPYEFLSSVFSDGDVLRITCTIDENGVFNKRIEKVMDKVFCENTKKSWDEIKHHWFRPQPASERLEQHLKETNKNTITKKKLTTNFIYNFFTSCHFKHDWSNWESNGFLYQWRYCKKCNKRQDKEL